MAHGQYVLRYSNITSGAVTFTGNTLGLDKNGGTDSPGTAGSIGTFITTNTSLRDNASWPFGTTGDWHLDRSEAQLRLPTGATVLHAELVWGGTWAEKAGQENVAASLGDAVMLTTPLGSVVAVPPDPAIRRMLGTVDGSGKCINGGHCFYVNAADVTTLVQNGGVGTYGVGRVPGTQSTNENDDNCAGWTLAVVYQDFNQPIRDLTLFIGSESSGAPAAQVTGFCTPPSGPLAGRLAVSALEGDAKLSGDQMLFGTMSSLGAGNRVSGTRNPPTNFFAGQINDDAGNLDPTGTFGDRNHDPNVPTAGARQGWDITQVDVTPQIVHNQTSAFAQGTTSGDGYVITTLGLAIQVGAPQFRADTKTVDRATARVGDVLTYTVVLDNSAGTADASNVVFFDPPPPGTTFVAGSFTRDGSPQPGADVVAGVPIGTIPTGGKVTVTFQAQVTAVPASPADAVFSDRARFTFDYQQCAGQPSTAGQVVTNPAVTNIARIVADKVAVPAAADTGQTVVFSILVTNTGTAPATNVTVTDPIPAGLTYVPGSTQLNLVSVPDVGGAMPFAAGGPVNSNGAPAGQIDPGAFAAVTFEVVPAPNTTGPVLNTATIEPDGPGGLPPFSVSDSVTVTPIADLAVQKQGPAMAVPGTNAVYTTTITNLGPSDVPAAMVTDPIPATLGFVSNTGACTTPFPCSLGPLAAGTSVTITTTLSVPSPYVGPDPIVNTATVSVVGGSPVDRNPGNDSNTARTSVTAPVADLGVTKTHSPATVVPGGPITYTMVVTNAGPSLATGAQVTDTFPATLLNPTWTCAATAGASCPAAGSGSIAAAVTIPPAGAVTFSVAATVDPSAVGTLVNTVTVAPPANVADPNAGNNTATDRATLAPSADLEITKTGPATAAPGGTVSYTITVVNHGPSAATDVQVFDPATPSLRLRSLPGGCTSFQPCDLGTLLPGDSRTLTATFDVPVDAPVPGILTNVASVSSPTDDPDLGNNRATAHSTLAPSADVVVTKGAPQQVTPGQNVTYTLTVRNDGPSIASAVTLDDPAPSGLTFSGNAGDCATAFPCTIGDLAPGMSRTVLATFTIPPDYKAPDPVANTATARSETPDPAPGNNSASATSSLFPVADIAVEKHVSTPAAIVGDTVTYTVVVTNKGPSDATAVTVRDVLSPALTLGSAVPDTGTYDPGSGTWAIGDMALGAVATLTSTVTVITPGELRNVATKTGANEFDPDTSNNSAAQFLNATLSADVGIRLAADNLTPAVGEFVGFTVTVTNRGPNPATNIVISPALLSGVVITSAQVTQGTIDATALTWSVGTLLPGEVAELTGVAQVIQPGILLNAAEQTHTEPDPNPANDRDSLVLNAGESADLQVSKGVSDSAPQVGASVDFTITIRNNGPSPATGVVVADPLPDGLEFVSATPSAGTYDPTTGRWEVGALPVSVFQQLALRARVTRGGTLVNTASRAASDQLDPIAVNDSDSAQVNGLAISDVQVTKTGSPSPVNVGTALTYTITVTNAGPNDAPDAVVTDTIPPTTTLQSATASAGSCTGTATVTCALGLVPVSGTATVTIVVIPFAPGPIPNEAMVSTSAMDPDLSNNTSRFDTTAVSPPSGADLSLIKRATPTEVAVGEQLTYTVQVTNAGPSMATGVTVTDSLPPGVRFDSVSPSQGSCTLSGAQLKCDLGTLPAGASATVTIVTTRTDSGTISNAATVTGIEPDTDLSNNSSMAVTGATVPETCGNCVDDDGNGLVDGEDPACCTAQPLTVTRARFRPGTSTLRVQATLAEGAFAGLDPRTQDVQLQVRGSSGEVVCCTIPSTQWQKLFRRSFGFFDQSMTLCPPIKCVSFSLPRKGPAHVTIIAGRVKPGSALVSPLQITISAADQCTAGPLTLHPKTRGHGAVFP